MFIKNNYVQHSCTHVKNEKGSLSFFNVKSTILFCSLLLPFQAMCTPPEDEHSPAIEERHFNNIRDNFSQFRTALVNQPTQATQDNNSAQAQETKKMHAKNRRNFKILAFTTSVLGCVGWMYQLDPVNTVSRAHHQTRTFGVIEGATALATIAPPLLTAGAAWLIWYKFNNLLHYPCKIERERDMESVSAQMTKTKTDMTHAFDAFTQQTENSLAQMRQQAEKKAQEERAKNEAWIKKEHEYNEKRLQTCVTQMQEYKKVMDNTLHQVTENVTHIQTELQTTAQTNEQLKGVVEKALPLLTTVTQKISDLHKKTDAEIAAINAKKKQHHRMGSGLLHLFHKANGECKPHQAYATLSPRSHKKKNEEKSDT